MTFKGERDNVVIATDKVAKGGALTAEQIAAYEAEPIALEPWDPMGSLAVVR